MAAARGPWWIVGSAAVALHGHDPGAVADVDVLVGVDDARPLLMARGIAVRPGAAHPRFRSAIFARMNDMALPVEIMAGFAFHDGAGWRTVAFATREAVRVGPATLFVPEQGELIALLRGFGRDKDRRRAALIA